MLQDPARDPTGNGRDFLVTGPGQFMKAPGAVGKWLKYSVRNDCVIVRIAIDLPAKTLDPCDADRLDPRLLGEPGHFLVLLTWPVVWHSVAVDLARRLPRLAPG